MARTPRVLLISPHGGPTAAIGAGPFFRLTGTHRTMPPLALLTVAGHLPRSWPIRLIDENVRPVPDEAIDWADYVLMSAMFPQKQSLARLAERAAARGKHVIAGGPFVTTSRRFVEGRFGIRTVCLHECEPYVEALVRDMEAGTVRPVYGEEGVHADLAAAAIPRFDLLDDLSRYLMVSTQVSRGCPYGCEFCDVPSLLGRRMRYKRPDQVCAELDALHARVPRGQVFLCDDNLTGHPAHSRAVLEAMAEWQRAHGHPFTFCTQVSVDVGDRPEALELLYAANVRSVFCGIESAHPDSLREVGKRQNLRGEMEARIAALIGAGIEVNAYLMLGFDSDPPDIAQRQLALVQRTRVTLAHVSILAAMDGTPLGRRLEQEGRLLSSTADAPDAVLAGLAVARPNFVPRLPGPLLQESYASLVESLYAPAHWYRRTREMVELLPDRDRYHLGLPMRLSLASLALTAMTLAFMPARGRLLWEALVLGWRTRQPWRFWRFVYAVFATGISIGGYRASARRVRAELAASASRRREGEDHDLAVGRAALDQKGSSMKKALRVTWLVFRAVLIGCGGLFLALAVALWSCTSSDPGFHPQPDTGPKPPAGASMGDAPPREAVVGIFERTFASKDLDGLMAHYHPEAVMHDTWRRCEGATAIRDYYAKQFQYAQRIHLEVGEYLQDHNRVMLRFHGQQHISDPSVDIDLPGVLYLEFRDGKIWYQREYWDGTAFLDGVPLMGAVFRGLRNFMGGGYQ